jgi:integrase
MRDDSRVITLIDQFDKVLDLAGITHNSHGDKYTLHSLRHFYAVLSLRRGIGVFDVARNMSTSGQVIQNYYGNQTFRRNSGLATFKYYP